jgi:filamentous hemagglutinin family protein
MPWNSRWVEIAVGLCVGGLGQHQLANAQINPDATLPVNSIVTPQNNTFQIDGGTAAGTNLFHSFQEFSLPTGSEAFFNNSLTVENIITRVTGGHISNIDGLIRANGTANLFLLNPNGIVFGANARLDIGGSFLGSTADRVLFEDGSFFSATDTAATPPLLTINVPIGLQFGAQPGGIRVEGPGSNLLDPKGQPIVRDDRTLGLQVRPERTLALVGGNLELIGGNLTAAGDVTPTGEKISSGIARGGRIELGSVAGNNTVSLTPISEGWALGYEGIEDFQDIYLTGVPAPRVYKIEGASLDVSGSRAGTIQIRGRSIYVRDGSAVLALTLGSESSSGDAIFIGASELLEVSGRAEPQDTSENAPYGIFSSAISAEVWLNARGRGGNITIETPHLEVNNQAFVSTGTRGKGDGGELIVRAPEINLRGGSLFARSAEEGSGRGGNIYINTDRLTVDTFPTVITVNDLPVNVRVRGQIATSTQSSGMGGDITIQAQEIEVITNTLPADRDVSAIRSTVDPRGTGDAGNITIETDRLRVLGGSSISTTTQGRGHVGSIEINAREIELSGEALVGKTSIRPSQIAAQVNPISTGNRIVEPDQFDIDIQTDRLIVANGARIAVTTQSSQNAGNLNIEADTIELIGIGRLQHLNSTSNMPSTRPSRLEAQAEDTQNNPNLIGDAGSINVQANFLRLTDGARILVRSKGAGTTGNLEINSSHLQLRNGSQINAEADLDRPIYGPKVSNQGGNITINTDTLTAGENSDITANAEEGKGGNIRITAQGIFGTEVREGRVRDTPQSDITATGKIKNGTIEIQTPDIDPRTGLLQLPETPVDVTALIGRNPCAQGVDSEFVDRGRGGLPPIPSEALRGEEVSVDLIDFPPDLESRAVEETQTPERVEEPPMRQFVEAQGWIVDAQGRVILTANPPTVTPHGSGERSSCRLP